MTSTNKIIIFLTPLSNSEDRKRRRRALLNSYCWQNSFTILKTLEKSLFDHAILKELINQIVHEA